MPGNLVAGFGIQGTILVKPWLCRNRDILHNQPPGYDLHNPDTTLPPAYHIPHNAVDTTNPGYSTTTGTKYTMTLL